MDSVDQRFELESEIVKVLRNIYDPEIPVNIYDLGLIYEIEVEEEGLVKLVMTLTAPNCPLADNLLEEVNEKVREIKGVKKVDLKLVFDPPWNKDMLSDAARLELGLM
jgi:FeS assembly SUF system protein